MAHVCPWWVGYFIDNPLRRWIHNPEQILRPYVKPGMRVLDFGCGMGLFAIAMAKMVGDDGCVVAVDLQRRMLDTLKKRAAKAGVAARILASLQANSRLLDSPPLFSSARQSAEIVFPATAATQFPPLDHVYKRHLNHRAGICFG